MIGSSRAVTALFVLFPFFGFGRGHDDDSQRFVDCDRGETIQEALRTVLPGDTLFISGTCNENVTVSSPTGQFNGVTFDGRGTASISGPNTTQNTLELDGVSNFTVRGLRISGGFDGLSVNTGSQIAVDTVVVDHAGRHGIHFQRGTTMAFIINSTIQNNPQNGVIVNENSYARIGFTSGVGASEDDTGPCVIQGNGGHGIRIQRSSSARVYTNTISHNGQNGVNIESASYAEIATNTINGNAKNGVAVTENSTLHLGNPTGTKTEDNPDSTTVANGQFGLQAQWGSFVSGRLGTLTGVSGASSFTHNANDDLTP
ncbi:MAG TPA: right-handed parallel beta-helix repeat-containing protein [Polyangiaceae bacterium]|nr:right-handed parallel beta-helix repeat-containing protein [Polyangiaceae bacterium]